MARVVVGVIGGTGLGEALGALGGGEVRELDTPFGRPSAPVTLTEVAGVPVALLPRHGVGHMRTLLHGLSALLAAREIDSLRDIRGRMSQRHLRNPTAFETCQLRSDAARLPCAT